MALNHVALLVLLLVPTIQAQNNTTELAEIYEEGDEEEGTIFDDEFVRVNDSWNGTEEAQNDTQPREHEWTGTVIQQVVTLSIIMLLTLIGNTIIVLVLSLSRYRKRSPRVNIFILNLAIGDLAVCFITMASELIHEVFGEWMLGPVACKVILYAQIVTLASTTFMLTSMSYDRFLAICRPLRTPGNALAPAKRLIAGSWCLAFVLAIPQIFIFVQVEEVDPVLGITRVACESKGYTAMWQRKLYFTWLTSYILIIPGVIISYCYINVLRTVWKAAREHPPADSTSVFLRRSQNAHATIPRAKIKTLKLTISIIASFVICWTPYFIINMVRIYSDYEIIFPKNVSLGVQTLALLNSALNPIFYGLFNVRLRKDFREIVYRRREFGASPSPQHFEVPALAADSSDTYIGSMGNTTPHPFRKQRIGGNRTNMISPPPFPDPERIAPKYNCSQL